MFDVIYSVDAREDAFWRSDQRRNDEHRQYGGKVRSLIITPLDHDIALMGNL
jgi:hypothetical protein